MWSFKSHRECIIGKVSIIRIWYLVYILHIHIYMCTLHLHTCIYIFIFIRVCMYKVRKGRGFFRRDAGGQMYKRCPPIERHPHIRIRMKPVTFHTLYYIRTANVIIILQLKKRSLIQFQFAFIFTVCWSNHSYYLKKMYVYIYTTLYTIYITLELYYVSLAPHC